MTKSLRAELLIVLTLTFGISGVRAVLNLINSFASPQRLNEQSVTLNSSQSSLAWVDMGLQLCSAAVLCSYGALALFLLAKDHIFPRAYRARDWLEGAGLAALIGIPGLALYFTAVHFGWSKEVIPGDFANAWVHIPVSLFKAAANAFAEETVVVMWFMTRLRQARWSLPTILAASSVLRGSYHLYQGVSAGCGNIVMGLVYGYYYHRTGRVWPLVIAHFLIDAVAFVGYSFL